MNFNYFVGIDVSKSTLDFTVLLEGNALFHIRTSNSTQGITSFFKKLKQQDGYQKLEVLYCLEHTGIYNNPLLRFFEKQQVHVWIQSAREIKLSLGVQRGKNDKIDSLRIAKYAFRNRDIVNLWKPTPKKIRDIKYMLTIREQLVRTKRQLTTALKQPIGFVEKDIYQLQKTSIKPVLEVILKKLKVLDKKIELSFRGDQQLDELYQQVTSVDHIGPTTAAHIIASTNGFVDFTDPKKFACYSGVVPFQNQSGSSLKGTSRVSHLANKKIKTLLHLAAMSAINHSGELHDYYHRKVEEGKNKMSVLNAVRNKLIHRIFAVVRDKRKYEKNYNLVLA